MPFIGFIFLWLKVFSTLTPNYNPPHLISGSILAFDTLRFTPQAFHQTFQVLKTWKVSKVTTKSSHHAKRI